MKDKAKELALCEELGDRFLLVIGGWGEQNELVDEDRERLAFLTLMGMVNTSPMLELLAGVTKIEVAE